MAFECYNDLRKALKEKGLADFTSFKQSNGGLAILSGLNKPPYPDGLDERSNTLTVNNILANSGIHFNNLSTSNNFNNTPSDCDLSDMASKLDKIETVNFDAFIERLEKIVQCFTQHGISKGEFEDKMAYECGQIIDELYQSKLTDSEIEQAEINLMGFVDILINTNTYKQNQSITD